jgi:outer membrane protein assembly factor BamB
MKKQPGAQPPQNSAQGVGDLLYHGGPVEETPTAYLIFWGPTWNNGSGGLNQDGQIVENFFMDVGNTLFEAILTQYYDTNAHIPRTLNFSASNVALDFSAPPTDTTCNSQPTVEDASLQAEVHNTIVAKGWPTDANATYFVYTPSNEYINAGSFTCSEINFCGYHSFSGIAGVPYAAIAYPFNLTGCSGLPSSPNGDIYGDTLVNISSHEQFESISDPELNAWYDSAIPNPFEIGDKCAYDFSSGLTSLNNGHTYAVQTEYSNLTHACVNTLAASALQVTPSTVALTTTPGKSPGPQTLTLSNTGSAPLNWSANGLPAWVSVSPTSGTLASGSSQPLTLTFSTPSTTPQVYSTTLQLADPGAANSPLRVPITVVATTVSKTWYFAEGYTGASFSEFLTIENPNPAANTATVQYFLGSGAPITKTYALAANSRTTLVVNQEIGPNQNVSLVVTGTLPIVAERPMYFTYTGLAGYSIPGGTDVLGATALGQHFDFGYLDTTTGHDPYLTFLNPNTVAMNVTIQYFAAAGGAPLTRTHTFPANSRGTINIRTQETLPQGLYSALISLDQPGLVERPFYFQDSVTGYTGSADVVGVATPQTDWYFAEGYTNTNFSERYYLANPNLSGAASATVTFFLSNGSTQSQTVSIPAGGLVWVDVNALLGTNVNNSAHVSASLPILAERFMSFSFPGATAIPGATDVLGTTSPSNLFYFAEGYTGAGFDEYLTIENPSAFHTATVTVTFFPDNGSAPTVKGYSIVPSSRFTLFTADVLPNQAFSMQVESNVPIVAERPMYFNYNNGQTGGTDVIGYQPPASIIPATSPSNMVFVGSGDNFMYALNATTGALIWHYQTPGGTDSTAALANGILYFGSSDGYFYALNASNGTLFWRTHLGAMSYPASAVVNGVVYITAATGSAYALDAADGSIIWGTPLPNNFNSVVAAPLVANGTVYVMVDGENLSALSAVNGSVLWSYQSPAINNSTPAIDNGLVYFVDSDDVVNALHADSGTSAWNSNALGGTGGGNDSVAAANGVVYVINLLGDIIYAFNDTTGAVLWSAPAPSVSNIFISPAPAVANGILYAGDIDGNLYAYSASDGSPLWHHQTGAGVQSTPAVAKGIVYFGSNDDFIYALNASTGGLDWRFQTGGAVIDTPMIAP